ncbi:unnamed protein product [Gongylonema pulchrum]|uniref:Catalase domain-containing protein n=1 Tax=Gongylonema pulchrum TaxID=637853 RepID=A0A183DGS6_9BILA|nr:unnamed protein product [Gongylonema pulchrum]
MSFDFWSLRPESVHALMFLFGDRGIPDGYRFMNGYSQNPLKLVNKNGDVVFAKFHIKVSTTACSTNNAAPSRKVPFINPLKFLCSDKGSSFDILKAQIQLQSAENAVSAECKVGRTNIRSAA